MNRGRAYNKEESIKKTYRKHKQSHGVIGIFGEEAQFHGKEVSNNQYGVKALLEKEFPTLIFRFRPEISKKV